MKSAAAEPARRSTRERLKRAAVRLFAERGFDGVTVGEIEAAAGLQPRRGGLYRHFASKHELLRLAVEEAHTADRQRQYSRDTGTLSGSLESAARIAGRWVLEDCDAMRDVIHVIEREGHRLEGIRDVYAIGADSAYRNAAAILLEWAEANGVSFDAEAASAHLVGGLVNHRRFQWTFGRQILAVDDDRLLDAFARLVVALM